MNRKLEEQIVNTIRALSMDAVQKANSGHPGTPMALAPVGFVLYDRVLKFNPHNPLWLNRDRFVLSAGHASMLLYSLLHIFGFPISLEDIKQFRQWGSVCAGHPEVEQSRGIEMTTGPLGQGAATSVGMAIAEKWLAAHFNRPGFPLFDYRIYALLSDGCMMEGISSEAASLAGHLGLDNLVWIYDDNHITIEGDTALAFSDNVEQRFKSYGWNVIRVDDANNIELLETALRKVGSQKGKPALVIVRSHIAYGSPNKQDTAEAHGAPLGEEEVKATKRAYNLDPERTFFVPDEIYEYQKEIVERGKRIEAEWNARMEAYRWKFPDLAEELKHIQNGTLPEGWDESWPTFPTDEKGKATRQINSVLLNEIAGRIPHLLGGSADLAPSNKTTLKKFLDFSASQREGRNFHFGIREQAMAACGNGMALSGLRPFVATFLVFSDYLRPALRLSALMKLPVIYIFTHDSIGLGEDGPTHQPIEHIASLRAIPELDVVRPADANELSVLWRHILSVTDHPVALILTRQAVPTLDRSGLAPAEMALRGAYVLIENDPKPEVILLATGSEVSLCLTAYALLENEEIPARVVSMPCWELFEKQPLEYRKQVLPENGALKIAVEAASPFGWERYTEKTENVIGIDRFGSSAPGAVLFEKFGFTAENIVRFVKERLDKK